MTTEIQLDKKTKHRSTEPPKWKVIIINDEITTFEFVVTLLMSLFNHNRASAEDITIQIHEIGAGVAGEYSFEIAETKASEAIAIARAENFPLQVKIEENN